MSDRNYRPSLSLVELLGELGELLAEQRRTERLVCRYLADLADRLESTEALLHGYVDIYQLARCRLGLGMRSTRERVRVGRALRDLPDIERAFIEGEISYSKVREVTRVASGDSEGAWLDAARELPVRELERRVAVVRAGEARQGTVCADELATDGAVPLGTVRSDETQVVHGAALGFGGRRPAETRLPSPDLVEFRVRLPAEVWALLERAMQGARDKSESSLGDVEALAVVARDALAQQGGGASVESGASGGATQSGSPAARSVASSVSGDATQSGSRRTPPAPTPDAALPPQSRRLLAIMGRRGGWHIDDLCEASGFDCQTVTVAMFYLRTAGAVSRDPIGCYAPTLGRG